MRDNEWEFEEGNTKLFNEALFAVSLTISQFSHSVRLLFTQWVETFHIYR